MTTGHGSSGDEVGSLVRPYLLASGRSRPSRINLDLITPVVALTQRIDEITTPEHAEIVRLCREPLSVAEISAQMNLPLMVVKVMIGDLIERGYVTFRAAPVTSDTHRAELLQAVLDGIRKM